MTRELVGVRVFGRILVAGLVVVALLCCAGGAVATWLWNRAALSTAGQVAFTTPLAVPPLAPSRVDDNGLRVFTLRAQAGSHDFGAGPVPTWGFNGDHLGPTLRAQRGEQVAVEVRNDLDEETSVHWHGMRLPAAMDGGPHQPVRPGTTWTPRWRVDQPAATLWYHPHPHGATERHVYRGLAGMFIVDDPDTDVADLPHRYGVDDIPVIVQDKSFHRDGRLDESHTMFGGVGILGDTVVVNGTVGPYLDVTTERVRLRLLNGSTARTYHFGFADGRSFALVGTDGGLLAEAVHTGGVPLSPGERAEIVVTVRPGERAVLRSTPPPLGTDGVSGRFVGGADTLDVLELRAAASLAPGPEVPRRLVDVPRLERAEAVTTRPFRLTSFAVNGRGMDMGHVDFAVERDSVEIWEVTNRDGLPHNFHVHDVQFQVLSVDGGPPPAHLGGWKDTLYTAPQVRYEIIMRFGGHPDPDVPYMYHCHLLWHEDIGMMGQFVVVEPGQGPGAPPPHDGHGRHD